VPAHDERDYEFAKLFRLPIVEVIGGGNIDEAAYTGDGPLVNSGDYTGMSAPEAKEKITADLEARGIGTKAINYKLRDWLFSRQRYWGEPFPIIYDEDDNPRPLPEEYLPITLPEVESYKPTGTGESPLAAITDWVITTDPDTGKPARRETNTMPQWAGSCWYYLRFIDPHNSQALVDPGKEKYWMPVDLYIGGAEHTVLHLLYARFWHKVLYDCGVVSTKEPFKKLFHQGLILGFTFRRKNGSYVPSDQVEKVGEDKWIDRETGQELDRTVDKMSKRWGNVVNPDEVVEDYGADTLRLYEMFMGPLEAAKPWDRDGVSGVYRFLARIWRLVVDQAADVGVARLDPAIRDDVEPDGDTRRIMHETIKKVTDDIEGLRFNTAISQMMIFVNQLYKLELRPKSAIETLVMLVSPFAPHLGEELWSILGHRGSIAFREWPAYDESALVTDEIEYIVQVGGKMRGKLLIDRNADKEAVIAAARELPDAAKHLDGKTVHKEVFVPGKIVNFVVG
jgi:leucyl-tRNA synthetase